MLRRFLQLFSMFRDLEAEVSYSQVNAARTQTRLLSRIEELSSEKWLSDEWHKTADDFREKLAKAEADLREWKNCAEREVENATSAHHLYERAKSDEQAQRELATEFKALFLAEKDKHQQALELLADWQGQRILGRTIFHHAPLLQPEKEATRERVPVPKSGRDRVREETQAFEERGRTIEQTIQRQKKHYAPNGMAPYAPQGSGMTQQQAADLESKEQARFFADAMQGYNSNAGENAA